ncbi:MULTISPECIES: AAA family ATPase [Aequorivita]|uniref:AAA family ATPase n=1 Tax=Aequorivita iocasae TaxID=2803865 RepID=A0ABX7DQW3_9FLAO|nr:MULTISPECIES: AAA family ATPase [Aequorivita]QQX76001.1 AAA family ATPase [Aequorivita iocasae]UCA55462.1 AAA family ATPase [Aequorivita sp. F7]
MIIKKIQIENYLCYYSINTFQFEDGLNIVLGENNEGKTKFFEAVEWLFDGRTDDVVNLISAKKLNEISSGDSFRVSVSMIVEQYETESKISRSFTVNKKATNEIDTSSVLFEGEETDNTTGERIPKNAQNLLDRIFPYQIRKYSMFKGETELNIFDNDEALANLINLFSDARHYEKYTEKGAFLRDKAEKAVEQSTRQNRRNQNAYNLLESEISQLHREKERLKVHLNSTEEEKTKLEKNIKEAEKYANNAKELETINKRIENIETKISLANRIIDFNFTTSLFDENWILVNFEPFHKEFSEKIAAHSIKRRELQSEYDKEKGIKEGEKRVKAELLNNAVPLPDNIPSKAIMEEMLSEKICKVCNRSANPNGTDEEVKAYNFMMSRLKTYLESQAVKENEPEKDELLFKYDYANRLENLSISHEDNLKNLRLIRSDIKDKFELISEREKEKQGFEELLEKEKDERKKILGDSKIADESKLLNVFKNYTHWQEDFKSINKDYFNLNTKFQGILNKIKLKQDEKDKIDLTSASSFLLKTRDILRHIEVIFNETKEKKFDEFINRLESKSNKYLSKINVEAFTGQIKFSKKRIGGDRMKIEVSLFESGGRYFVPGTAVRTSMNISILLAISELANEVRDETYPMIFDAPTSSFGETKTGDFLNLIYETSNQKIILLKDFIGSVKNPDGSIKELFIKNEFNSVKRKKAFWVKLERPFDKNILSTINTEVNPL